MSQTPADRGVHHFIRAAADGAIGRIIIDNAEARNGITADSCRMIAKAIDAFDEDASVRVIVLSGAGGHFCSGADLRQGPKILAGSDDDLHDRVRDGFHSAIEALHRCQKPTVALIRGACVGFGFDLALSCDLRLAADESKIGQVFSRIALVPDGGSSFTLSRLVGVSKALELFYLGDRFDGRVALEMGIVNRSVPDGELDALAETWLQRLAAGPPLAYRLGKANIRSGAGATSLSEALDREAAAQVQCLRSKDVMRGMQAFFAKTEPVFEGD